MRAHLNEDTEDEYVDDPIKLFDFEQERVHFGSQPLQCSNTNTRVRHQSEASVIIESNAEVSETSDGSDVDTEHSCEHHCQPSSVRLVDCGKFPWYYKKYSQQIQNKLNVFNLVSDSESDIDVSGNSSDCFIVEDLMDKLDRNVKDYSSKILPEVIHKTALEKRHETMKLKEDIEIQIALSLKNTGEIDLKRNTGLIGIKITHKPGKDNGQGTETIKKKRKKYTKVKQNEAETNKSFIKAADKVLSSIGTSLTAIPENNKEIVASKDETSTSDEQMPNNTKADELVKNLPVQFSLDEMSEKLLQSIITKKNNKVNNNQKNYPNFKTSFNSVGSPSKAKGSTGHVRNISKSNKYKNNQINTKKRTISELIASEINKKEKIKIDRKEAEQKIEVNQNSPKRVEDKSEPDSPILPCSSTLAKKKRKLIDFVIQEDNRDMHKIKSFTNKTNNNNKAVNKLTKDHSDKYEINSKQPLKQVSFDKNTSTSRTKVAGNKVSRKKYQKLQDTDKNTVQLNENVNASIKTDTNSNNKCFSNDLNINNDIDQTKLSRVVQNFGNRGVSVTLSESSNDSQTTTCEYTPSSSVPRPQSKPPVEDRLTNSSKSNSSISNVSGNENNVDNFKCNSNTTPNKSFGSAIILRPTQPGAFPIRGQLSHHVPPRMSFQMQPRFYQNPYTANYHKPPFNRDQRLNPSSANCPPANYRFPSPHEIGYHPQYYPPHFQPVHTGCYQPNEFPSQNGPSSNRIYSCQFPMTVLQMPQSCMNTKSTIDLQSKNDTQSHNCSNNEVLIKKKYVDPRTLPHDNEERMMKSNANNVLSEADGDLVASKTKMLEVLDRATHSLEKNINKDDLTIKGPENKCKRPKLTNKSDLTNEERIDQQRLYSKAMKSNINNVTLDADSELVASKIKMLEVLESATKDLKRGIGEDDITKKAQEPVNKFKRPKITNKTDKNEDDHRKQIDPRGGYSPPILPIPTFQNILHGVKMDVPKQDNFKTVSVINIDREPDEDDHRKQIDPRGEYSPPILPIPTFQNILHRVKKDVPKQDNSKTVSVINIVRELQANSKRTHSNTSSQGNISRKGDTKKISLEEYKKRTLQMNQDQFKNCNINTCRNGNDRNNANIQNKRVNNNVDRCSTESDLGYDSDSTVML